MVKFTNYPGGRDVKIHFEAMKKNDFTNVMAIYQEGIQTGHATFQTDIPSWQDWHRSHFEDCRIVMKKEDRIIAWAALNPVSSRNVYRGVAEVSIYVKAEFRKQGYGKRLLRYLIEASEKKGYWTLQSSIFPENKGSLKIHQDCGFKIVGNREKLGKMHDQWRDVYLLERRSQKVGQA